jgi:hypothetical protein
VRATSEEEVARGRQEGSTLKAALAGLASEVSFVVELVIAVESGGWP